MDQEKKIKIILGSVFALLLLGVLYLFLNRGGASSSAEEEVSARAIDSAEVSISDIMQHGASSPREYASYRPEDTEAPLTAEAIAPDQSPYENSEDIAKLQEQLRKNMQTQTQVYTQPREQSSYRQEAPAQTYAPSIPQPQPSSPRIQAQPQTKEDRLADLPTEATNIPEAPQSRSRFNSGMRTGTGGIKVIVLGEQELKNDSPLKLVLAQSVTLEGTTIPKGTALYGIVHTANGRMLVNVSTIQYRDRSFAVSLSAYDRDGLKGINVGVPENTDTSVQEVAEEAAQRTGIISGAVGAVAGTISGIFRRKGSSNTIIIKSNYQLSLR